MIIHFTIYDYYYGDIIMIIVILWVFSYDFPKIRNLPKIFLRMSALGVSETKQAFTL